MPIISPVCDMLKIEHPLLLAPMAGVSGGALAAAVSKAGGLGFVGGGYGDPNWLAKELVHAGGAEIGIGFISWKLEEQPELLDVALDHGPKAIFLSFGALDNFAAKIKRAGVPLIAQVQNLEQARAALDQGADIIVAQGTEAGGHGALRATLPLVPAVVDLAGVVPVVAAGGIADGRTMAASFMLGAKAVVCGSVFFVSHEALSHDNAKAAAIASSGDDTVRSSAFDIARGLQWPKAWDLRTLNNQFTKKWSQDSKGLAVDLGKDRSSFDAALISGDVDIAPVIVGEAADMICKQRPAKDIVRQIVGEAELLLRSAPNLVA